MIFVCYADHPCSRGENDCTNALDKRTLGSSLLARGKHEYLTHRLLAPRIIPARAGKTLTRRLKIVCYADHPCLRGENAEDGRVRRHILGSSLLARGKLDLRFRHSPTRGIIPACAGKTATGTLRPPRSPDHPCLRGENGDRRVTLAVASGSSLLARGKPAPGDS